MLVRSIQKPVVVRGLFAAVVLGISLACFSGALAGSRTKGFSVLYEFQGTPDGSSPQGGVIVDKDGDIFGTTYYGGLSSANCGTVFELTPSGGSYAEQIILPFGGTDGCAPGGAPVINERGDLFVTAGTGGQGGYGTVVELTSTPGGFQEAAVFSFGDKNGTKPQRGLFARGKMLYTTTDAGGHDGRNSGGLGYGVVAALTQSGLNESVLFDFNGYDGSFPLSTLVADSAGVMYGTTSGGGYRGDGTVFQVVPQRTGAGAILHRERVLWSFEGQSQVDGAYPLAGVVLDKSGNIYGTTIVGGANNDGIVFKLTPNGSGYGETILHSFAGASDGSAPRGDLVLEGNELYGTTSQGGGGGCTSFGCGTIFQVSTDGSNYAVLHAFQGSDGASPEGKLFLKDRALYGAAQTGGAGGCSGGCGVVFSFGL